MSRDKVTPKLSKNIFIVEIACFLAEIFALKVDVFTEISEKKQQI